jgi:hypothetical protein
MSFAGLSEQDRAALNTQRARELGFDCSPGSNTYCSKQIRTPTVPGSGAGIFHRTKTTISDGKATTDVYIISDGKWVIAARTTDGGKTYFFSEETRPNGTKIVGDGVRQSLASGGDMNKNVTKQVNDTLKSGGAGLINSPQLTDTQIREVGAIDNNTATTVEETTGAAGLTAELSSLSNVQIKSRGNKISSDTRFVYPIGLETSGQDKIQFSMFDYVPPQSGGGFEARESGILGRIDPGTGTGTSRGNVFLPIQPTIIDTNSVTWQQDSINPIELAALELSTSGIRKGVEGINAAISNIASTLGNESDNIQSALIAGFAGAAIGKNVLPRVTGGILNPNIELLFNAPNLRVFNYRFQLSARDDTETNQIRGIIRWFKQGMSVQRTEGELFLKTPNIFKIKYLYQNDDHPYLNRIKTCALTNCSVDYTPTGSYMTFKDGSMVSYAINLTFEELEPIYYDDYDKVGGIGF